MNLSEVDVYLRNLRGNLLEALNDASPSDKLLLASNVFDQIQEHIPSLATHQVLSKYVEKLIMLLAHSLIGDPQSEFEEKQKLLMGLMKQLMEKADVEVLSKDVFGSHVLQTLLQCCTLFEHNGVSLQKNLQNFATTIEDRCLFELLHHTSGSHVLRSLIKALEGVLDADAFQKTKRRTGEQPDELLPSKEKVDQWRINCLNRWVYLFYKDLNGTLANNQSCATFCLLLKLCQAHPDDNTEEMSNETLSHCFSRCNESKTASFVAEQCLQFCQNAAFNRIFKTYVLPNAQELCESPYANYVIQAMIRHQYFQASNLEEIIEAIDISKLLLIPSSSIVWRLCESAVILGACQSLFIKKLMKALGVAAHNNKGDNKSDANTVARSGEENAESKGEEAGSDNEFSEENGKIGNKGYIWLALVSCEPVKAERIRLKATGASIVLNLLKFERKLIENILSDFRHFLKIAKSQDYMATLATDRHFSRVLQLMLDRRQGLLKEKQVIKLFNYLKSDFRTIAMNTNGAFVLSSLFNACSVDKQQELLAELVPELDRIKAKNKRFAEIIGLETFKKNEELWMSKRKKTESVRSLFKGIIEPTS
ncbi:nucleolar protein 9 like protein [Babesia gibsoni]|uniref:Nucleolar protein 9 like protein n=1 Tax=Babesia gibsoni TaxID=33632 RepID=A0AAD8PGH9_BABGI|nr:nucleolar protein 9 like protein [Babesia gibsoni]